MSCPVKILSRNIVRPSSPTPDHLKTLKLSFLDQVSPPLYISLIFFYHHNQSPHPDLCPRLIHSLSHALTFFYPLAGKLDPDNFAVDCDDSGAEFVEARVAARLTDLLHDPALDQLEKLLPGDPLRGVYAGEGTVFMAQANFFDCGGVAIATCVSHNVADNQSLVDFVNAWAGICRAGDDTGALEFNPQFGAVARHFPARDLSDSNFSPSFLMADERLITTRFVFDKVKITSLQNAARSNAVGNPTRVESVSAFIWKYFLDKKSTPGKTLAAGHAVNIRSRADPSLGFQNAFGNGIILGAALIDASDAAPKSELAARLRKAITKIDATYTNDLENNYVKEIEKLSEMVANGKLEALMFSSWCRFPVYEVDFGWGAPAWVCTTALLLNNLTILMSGKNTEEIEAWINLLPEDIESFALEFQRIGTI